MNNYNFLEEVHYDIVVELEILYHREPLKPKTRGIRKRSCLSTELLKEDVHVILELSPSL